MQRNILITTPRQQKMEISFSENNYLGEGVNARVVTGEIVSTKEKIALKMMDTRKPAAKEICEIEIAIMKTITNANTTNLMTMTGYYLQNGFCFIAMPLAEYGSVVKWLTTPYRPFTSHESYQIVEGTLTGLSYMHQLNILHLDIKPANVLLTANMQPYLCDFGLSKRLKIDDLSESEGTPLFMSPALLSDVFYEKLTTPSKKDDMYSFSLFTWCIYSNQPSPYDHISNNKALMTWVCLQEKREPLPADCPPKIAELIKNGWHANPHKRRSAHEALAKLNEVETVATDDAPIVIVPAVMPTTHSTPVIGGGFSRSNGLFASSLSDTTVPNIPINNEEKHETYQKKF
ncbi:MAG: serine/threonine-protein kinase [Gammaproteobacteria bacterium]|nr:serine/threonine-protein kinase [Gammaproteobacteria bacterium]